MFPREFFYQLEDTISRAAYDINERYLMRAFIDANTPHISHEKPKVTAVTTPLDRLKGKFLQARGVAQRVATNMEAEADSLIAQEDAMKAKTANAFAPHKAILAEASTELKAIEDALNLMSNGGPSLDPLPDAGTTAPSSTAGA